MLRGAVFCLDEHIPLVRVLCRRYEHLGCACFMFFVTEELRPPSNHVPHRYQMVVLQQLVAPVSIACESDR